MDQKSIIIMKKIKIFQVGYQTVVQSKKEKMKFLLQKRKIILEKKNYKN